MSRISQQEFAARCTPETVGLEVDDARDLVDLTPLASATSLRRLRINLPFRVTDVSPVGAVTTLVEVMYGNSHLGNDRVVAVPDLAWARTLIRLERLELPGTRLVDADLAPLLELPLLTHVGLPLRRGYRNAVFAYAGRSAAFAALAARYREHDELVARTQGGS